MNADKRVEVRQDYMKIVCQSAAYCHIDTAVQAEKEITFAK